MGDSFQDYLTAKYLSTSKADLLRTQQQQKGKKKRRKIQEDGSRSSLIVTEDGDDWVREKQEEDEGAMVVESRANAGFKPIVQKEEEEPMAPDEAPAIVGPIIEEKKKSRGGLQMAADVAKEAQALKQARLAQQERERRQLEEARRASGLGEGDDDTVVRGPDGRPIDKKQAKAEEARRRREEVEKAQARMEWGKGLVQREDKEKRKEEEAAIAARPMARFADDVDLNQQQKDVDRWNDPAARFLTRPKESKKATPSRPRYTGPPPPPNRFGILPGYRWDGVDRSNGFEKKVAQAGNERKVRNEFQHSWNTEDM